MGLKRIGKGPFGRLTQPKIFQTVDIGSGKAEWIMRRAKRNSLRNYAVVDPAYCDKDFWSVFAAGQTIAKDFPNIKVAPQYYSAFIDEMKKNGWKARHINIDMPDIATSLEGLFREAPNILLPNGKIFVTAGSKNIINNLCKDAEEHGLKVRELKPLLSGHIQRLTGYMKEFSQTEFYRLEITFGLKKAIPDKKARKN